MSSEILSTLRAAIEASDESLQSIARGSGVDVAAISRFVRGERSITVETAEKLCRYLGVTITAKRKGAKR